MLEEAGVSNIPLFVNEMRLMLATILARRRYEEEYPSDDTTMIDDDLKRPAVAPTSNDEIVSLAIAHALGFTLLNNHTEVFPLQPVKAYLPEHDAAPEFLMPYHGGELGRRLRGGASSC